MNKQILVIGYGEIGKAISTIELENNNTVHIWDVKSKLPEPTCKKFYDVGYICYPFDKHFIDTTLKYMLKYNCVNIWIINSTIDIDTISKLRKKTNNIYHIVHSPVIGVHPNLVSGIKTFPKYIGGDNVSTNIARKHFESLGIKTIEMTAEESAAGKMLDTTYYGWNIIYMKEVQKFCEKNNLDFDIVYTLWNNNYNKGYTKLGMKNVVRPVLKPMSGPIGGHCVVPNFKILKKKFKLAKVALKFSKKYR